MHRGLTKLTFLCVLAALVGATACSKDDSQLVELDAARQEALADIEAAKAALDAKRVELADLRESLANPDTDSADTDSADTGPGDTGPGGEGEAEPMDSLTPEAQADALKAEIDQLADDLGGKIVTFINDDPPIADEPLSETLQKAVDIKVDEDILLSREYIQEGGDYRRAISILEAIQPLAMDDQRLADELEQARANRWMTEERFAAVKNGFDEDQVREAIGPVNLRNLKEYPDNGVTAWFYLKEGGGAAGVYFREKNGKLVVYKADFNAVKREGEDEDA